MSALARLVCLKAQFLAVALNKSTENMTAWQKELYVKFECLKFADFKTALSKVHWVRLACSKVISAI